MECISTICIYELYFRYSLNEGGRFSKVQRKPRVPIFQNKHMFVKLN